jgi:lipopolysaccharide transport system ATP-binding protein
MKQNSISIKNLSIEFPNFSNQNRLIKNKIFKLNETESINKNQPNSITVLKNINLEINSGDRILIHGNNGSGKSTILRVLAGIYPPSKGEVKVKGRVIPLLDIFLGMFEDATGYENILLRGLLFGVSNSEMLKVADEIIDFAELGEYIYMPMRTYSSGMSMRLAFSISTCLKGDILLLDEWLSVGDDNFKIKSTSKLESMINKTEIVVLATHNKLDYNKLFSKKIVMNNGSIETFIDINYK